tara:strand:- start:9338 stop:9574 length:237 start_codon:yes stop_codon:yes gene_type:complete
MTKRQDKITELETHAYINIVTEDKARTMETLSPLLNSLGYDEIDADSFEFEIRLYFDGEQSVSRISYAVTRLERLLGI